MSKKKATKESPIKMGQEYFSKEELNGMSSKEYNRLDNKYSVNSKLTFTMSDTPYFNYDKVFGKKK